MRLGYCCNFSSDEADWAKQVGFTTIEIGYVNEGEDSWKKARAWFDANNMYPMTVFHYGDYGSPNAAEADHAIHECFKAMEMCKVVGAPVLAVNALTGHTGTKSERISAFKRIFTPFAEKASDMGLKIAIENCPHELRNSMWSPSMWEAGFNEVPNKALGLEFDPSHLVWSGVDYVAALKKFVGRTYAFHAKDTEVFDDVLAYEGIYGEGWWRFRIPGWGEVDWQKLFTILWTSGYQGDMTIEHEDPVFCGARNQEGLVRGLEFLKGLAGDISK